MNKTCDNCKYMARHSDLCCLKIADWKLRPESNTCDNWGAHPLVQLGIDIERTRCARICADRAERLAATAEQYPAGTAVCFAAEARECERLIRGEQ